MKFPPLCIVPLKRPYYMKVTAESCQKVGRMATLGYADVFPEKGGKSRAPDGRDKRTGIEVVHGQKGGDEDEDVR